MRNTPFAHMTVPISVQTNRLRILSDVLQVKVTGILPTFIIREKKIFCFWDLTDTNCPFRSMLSADVINYENVHEWIKNENKNRWLMELLNKGLKHYCEKLYLRFDSKHKRYYFLPERNQDRKILWSTGKRRATRAVVKKHTKGRTEQVFWSHQALQTKFVTFDDDIFLQLIPKWTFTTNGIEPLPPDQIGPLSTKWTAKEHNASVFYHIRFWLSHLSQQSKKISVPLGKYVCEIDTIPAMIKLNKGLGDDLNPIDTLFEIASEEIQSTDILRKVILENEDEPEQNYSENVRGQMP